MRIEGPYKRPAVSGKSGTRGSSAGRPLFELDQTHSGSRPQAAHAASTPTEMDAILALQTVDDPLQGKRKAITRGRDLLDNLDALKAELLTGHVSEARLDRLLSLVRQTRQHIDPELDAAIEDIELRVLVELAKLGRFVS